MQTGGLGCVHVAGPARYMLRVMAHTYIHFRLNMFCFSARVRVPVLPYCTGAARRTCAARSVAASVPGPSAASPESVDTRDACFTNFNLPSTMREMLQRAEYRQ